MIKGPILMALCATAIILLGMMVEATAPRCDAHSLPGPRIGGAILIAGCP